MSKQSFLPISKRFDVMDVSGTYTTCCLLDALPDQAFSHISRSKQEIAKVWHEGHIDDLARLLNICIVIATSFGECTIYPATSDACFVYFVRQHGDSYRQMVSETCSQYKIMLECFMDLANMAMPNERNATKVIINEAQIWSDINKHDAMHDAHYNAKKENLTKAIIDKRDLPRELYILGQFVADPDYNRMSRRNCNYTDKQCAADLAESKKKYEDACMTVNAGKRDHYFKHQLYSELACLSKAQGDMWNSSSNFSELSEYVADRVKKLEIIACALM